MMFALDLGFRMVWLGCSFVYTLFQNDMGQRHEVLLDANVTVLNVDLPCFIRISPRDEVTGALRENGCRRTRRKWKVWERQLWAERKAGARSDSS